MVDLNDAELNRYAVAISSSGMLSMFDSSEEARRLRRFLERNTGGRKVTVNTSDLRKILNDLAYRGNPDAPSQELAEARRVLSAVKSWLDDNQFTGTDARDLSGRLDALLNQERK